MLASLAFDMTGSYDGFMIIMGVIFLASAALVYSTISGKPIAAAAPSMGEART
jgi:hypothetical protein